MKRIRKARSSGRAPVLAGNNLWAASTEGQVYRMSTGEGSATLYRDLKTPVSLAPVVANSTLYILDDSGAHSRLSLIRRVKDYR